MYLNIKIPIMNIFVKNNFIYMFKFIINKRIKAFRVLLSYNIDSLIYFDGELLKN